ncbi:nicotinate phosphoribosyltransferase [Candidatus Woesearchaeota archaeon]|nr:nicotinate phosphoribosyltransferase [Candidatus Woesearchaeota archaeon]MBI5148532.1 nicotinate phosphoribosyltransferase [Candidatus Pacearchaeota archaeon]
MKEKSSKNIPQTHLFVPEDLHLYDLPQIFSASATWLECGMENQTATFDLIIRDMPSCRNFLLFCGLEEIIESIKKWKYSEEEIEDLLNSKIITKKFAEYLKNFKFTGTIYAMPEGTVFFPGESVIRITAPIIEANLLTMFLINIVTGNTKFLSKVIRPVIASKSKICLGVAGLRAESFESAIKCARASYIAGAEGANSVPAFARKYNLKLIQPLTVAYHAVIKSFPTELEAMRKMANLFCGKISLMVDTYDFTQGVKNAITVANKLKQKGLSLYGIMIDSGDLFKLCVQARKMLDDVGLQDVKITVASNLDEYKIKELNDRKIPADAFLIATEAIAVPDAPKLETVYKLAELREDTKIKYCAKFSPGKESYPGRKQVFRVKKKGIFEKDIIGHEDENLGEPILVEVVRNGEVVYDLPSLDEIKSYVKTQLAQLPERFLEIDKQHEYKVEISGRLSDLFKKVQKEHSS